MTKPAMGKKRNFSAKRRTNAVRKDAISNFNFVVFSPVSFRFFEKTKRRHAKRRKDEMTPCEKRRKDAPRKDNEIEVSINVLSHGVFFFRLFALKFRLFASGFHLFVFSYGVISSFCMTSFRMASFRLFFFFVFLHGVFSLRKDEKTKWHKPATIHSELQNFTLSLTVKQEVS